MKNTIQLFEKKEYVVFDMIKRKSVTFAEVFCPRHSTYWPKPKKTGGNGRRRLFEYL